MGKGSETGREAGYKNKGIRRGGESRSEGVQVIWVCEKEGALWVNKSVCMV